jgi:plasmid stability protein
MAKAEKWHTVNTKIPSTLHRRLRFRAAREDKMLKDVFRDALTAYLKSERVEGQAP